MASMKGHSIVMVTMVLLAAIPISLALEPNQQFNKILLNPFYRQSMDQDIDYVYNIDISPPAGIASVESAIVTFQLWLNPTVEFFLEVNGQQCNTPSYEVHTTYAGAGEGTIFFDCSNIINHAGSYTITLTPDDDTGAITGWVDITYSDAQTDSIGSVGSLAKPPPSLELRGTEYLPNDQGTIFLQLRDEQGTPVLNGNCYLDIYSPLTNGTHPKYLNYAPMITDPTDKNGIYYYDLNTPTTEGNYMLAASCSFSYQLPIWVYGPESVQYAIENHISGGTWLGSSQALNDKADGIYEKCTSTSGTDGCYTTWKYQFPAGDYTNNQTSINLFYSGQANKNRITKFGCLNITNSSQRIPFTNQVTYAGFADGTTTTNIDDYATNILPNSCINRSKSTPNVTITFSIDDNGIIVYHDWLSLSVLISTGNVQDLRGNSEMHITDVPKEVWSYSPNRTLTDAQALFVGQTEYDVEETVGKIVIRMTDVTGDPVIGADCRYGILYPNGTPYIFNVSMVEHVGVIQGVYTADFNLSGDTGVFPYGADCSKGGKDYYMVNTFHVRDIAGEVWNEENRNLTYYYNATRDVWTYPDRNLTYYYNASIDVWNYPIRTLTDYYGELIAGYVWNATDRNLTYYSIYNATEDVWNYPNRILTYYPDTNGSAIWLYPDRNLTYYAPAFVNVTEVSDAVWTAGTRNLTYYQIYNATEDVWNYPNRILTYYPDTNATAIWEFDNRNLTYYQIYNGTTDFWSYPTRTLTYLNATPIVNETWNYPARYTHGEDLS